MLVTPDYGLSDVWNFNYPLKNLLSQSLKQGEIPLWTDLIGNGYPIAAEGQIGAFSPINWIIFGLFPMPQAFTAALVVAFATALTGSYLLMRKIGLPKLLSFVSAIFATSNGYFIVQITHLNLLQSFSFIPWAILFTEKLVTENGSRPILWLGFILAQMILAGYPQTFINCLFILAIFVLFRNWDQKITTLMKIFAAALMAILLSAIQLIPLFELVKQSDTLSSASNQRYIHPMSVKNLLTVIYPFIFGNPADGTYPYFGKGWPIFWENLLYVGIIPLLSIIIYAIKRKEFRQKLYSGSEKTLLAVFLASLILSLGKNTPAGLLFKFPPLSFTRIESRFLAFSNISLGLLAGLLLSKSLLEFPKHRRKVIIVTIAFLHIFQIALTFRGYHLWGKDDLWLNEPGFTKQLGLNPKIVTTGQEDLWRKADAYQGWERKGNAVLNAGKTMGPNSNMVFSIRQLGAYAQQYSRRFDAFRHFIYGKDTLGENIRDVFGVTHIIDASSGEIKISENQNAMPDIWDSTRIYPVKDIGGALGRMAQSDFIPGEILWENGKMPDKNEKIVVINRSWYPGWKAFAGNQQIEIYPANVNQQAVIVPSSISLSEIVLKYDPLSYKIGFAITLASSAIWVSLFLKAKTYRYEA